LTLIDTPGAFPGVTAEQRGQAVAIAESIRTMGSLPVPIVAVVTGEGGSGGALALGVADEVLISANGTYSVISPEGCASILWRDPDAAQAAAQRLRLDAKSLLRQGIVDAVVPEPAGGSHTDPGLASELLRRGVVSALRGLVGASREQLLHARHSRFRRFGTT
jgi:acetyl-CoA carboxylase carboxyl transferase alpha subunit